MTTIVTETAAALTPGQKAAATKGALGHKLAGIRAQITRAERLRDSLTGYDKGLATKRRNALVRELEALGGHYDA